MRTRYLGKFQSNWVVLPAFLLAMRGKTDAEARFRAGSSFAERLHLLTAPDPAPARWLHSKEIFAEVFRIEMCFEREETFFAEVKLKATTSMLKRHFEPGFGH